MPQLSARLLCTIDHPHDNANFLSTNAPRGGRIELKYHESCFSMIADPRSQPTSSANVGKFVGELKGTRAPEELYRKMRTRGHW